MIFRSADLGLVAGSLSFGPASLGTETFSVLWHVPDAWLSVPLL